MTGRPARRQMTPDGRAVLRDCILPLLIWGALVGISLFVSLRHLEESSVELATTQGREVFHLVEAMRVWNAEHGGIYVAQTERDPPNPYLQESIRSTSTITGKPLTLLNPAYMTRQISGVIEREAGIRLHLTSLNPINPNNRADAWETLALQAFERGALKESLSLDSVADKSQARYMAPLYVQSSCLVCHGRQGYKLGDVRGGLGVQWSVAPLVEAMHATRIRTIYLHAAVWLLISLAMVLAIRQISGSLMRIRDSESALHQANTELEATVEERTRQLVEAVRTLHLVGDMAPGVLFQYRMYPDGTTCIPYASEGFYDFFGVHPVELREDASEAFANIHDADLAGIVASIRLSARDLSRWHHEFRVYLADGRMRWLLGETQPIRESDGSTLWNGYFLDITERKEKDVALAESEQQFRLLFERITHGVVFQNEHGDVIAANSMAERILGLTLDQMQGRSSNDPRRKTIREDGSDFSADTHPAMQSLRTGKPVCDVVMGVFDPEKDQTRWLLVTAIPQFKKAQSRPFEVFTTFTDITQHKEAEAVLRQHKIIVDTAQDGFWMMDAQGNIHEANQAYADISGYSIAELSGMHISKLEANGQSEEVRKHLEKVIAQGHDLFETEHRHKDGHLMDIEVSVTFMPESQRFFAFCRDIHERKHSERTMRDLAYFDALTGLPNRRMLSDRLKQAMSASKRSGCFGAVMFLDLDNFKPINDQYGHEAGDALLVEASRRIKRCLREIDTVARFGGDEFVVMLTDLSEDRHDAMEQSRLVAEKIRQEIGLPYELHVERKDRLAVEVQHRCSASVGVSLFFDHEISEQDLLNYADKAMYQAKRSGRNQIRFFS